MNSVEADKNVPRQHGIDRKRLLAGAVKSEDWGL